MPAPAAPAATDHDREVDHEAASMVAKTSQTSDDAGQAARRS